MTDRTNKPLKYQLQAKMVKQIREDERSKALEEVEKNYIKKEDWIKQGLALIPVDSMIYIDDEIKFLKRICKVDNTDYRAIMDRIQQLTKLKEKEQ